MPPFFSPKRESRFQRLFTRRSEFLRRRPRFATANPSCGGLVVNCAVGASARRWNGRRGDSPTRWLHIPESFRG